MESYPEELRTPPVALVAVVGMPELHPQISLSLHAEQPPINTLALPDFSKVPAIGGKERRPLDAPAPVPKGILKANWLHKHRTKVSAVLVMFFDREQINGDSTQWLEVCSNIDLVKSVIRGRNTRLVLVIVQPTLYGETNDERLSALRKRAEVEAKYCLTFISQDPTELKRSLVRIGMILGELSALYYRDESRRVKARIDKKNLMPELAVRYSFKMAYYAEFRRDWPTALRCYETAYTLLQEVVASPADVHMVQRTVEMKAVAEQLHFKVSTLLLHSGRENDAVEWFRLYINRYRKLLGPPEGAFLHWAWVSQQYHIFGELLQSSLSSPAGLSDRLLQPGFYYQVAASYMAQRRESFQMAYAAFEAFDDVNVPDLLDGPLETIGSSLYVGQSPRIFRLATQNWESPTSDEYMRHEMLIEKAFSHSQAALALLTKSHEQYSVLKAPRMTYFIGTEMGREYFLAGEHENARRCFDSVAEMYRKEGWVMLLGMSLGYLREVARQQGLVKEYIEYSLELAALPILTEVEVGRGTGKQFGPAGPPGLKQRCEVFKEALGIMQGVQNGLPARDGEAGISATETTPIALEIDLVSPLRSVLSVCVTFHEQAVKPGDPVNITISLLTHLPVSLTLHELEIEFNQPSCNAVLRHSADSHSLELEPRRWKRLVSTVVSGTSGKLECVSAVARVGPHATIRCQVESPASREPDALWVLEPGLEISPVKDFTWALTGQRIIQVEEPDALVDIRVDVWGSALLGEAFPVKLQLMSTGHGIYSGELHISTSAGDVVQTPTTPASSPPPVEVYIPARLGEEDGAEISLWPLKSSIKVPVVELNESWSTTVFLRWKEAIRASVLVSLRYQTQQQEGYQLWVHKRMELQCQDALKIECRYIAPYRRDSFLLSSMKKAGATVLPVNETSTLVVNLKNTSSVPLRVLPVHVEEKSMKASQVRQIGSTEVEPVHLQPEEIMNQVFWLAPVVESSSLDIGNLAVEWERVQDEAETGNRLTPTPEEVPRVSAIGELLVACPDQEGVASPLERLVTSRVALPPVTVERAPLVVALQSPPYAVLGVPLLVAYGVQNRTHSLQEVNFSVVDAQGFLVSGASRGSISLLPASSGSVTLKLVPIACGMLQLPQVLLTALHYGASYQSSANIFVFPSPPNVQPS